MTSNMTLVEAVTKIRGEKGTEVNLIIIREDIDQPMEFSIKRDEITAPSVSYEEIDGTDYILISVSQFGENTTKEFNEMIEKAIIKNPKGIILDLRYNGGGYLDASVDMVSQFVSKGIVVIQKVRDVGKEKLSEEVINVSGNPKIVDVPMVVLVNEGTASASEIVAAALQYHKRATIVGKKTFGKGTVQEFIPLPDDSSLRLTIAKWYTPGGISIDKNGITPDVEVEYSKDEEEDAQLDKAIEILTSNK